MLYKILKINKNDFLSLQKNTQHVLSKIDRFGLYLMLKMNLEDRYHTLKLNKKNIYTTLLNSIKYNPLEITINDKILDDTQLIDKTFFLLYTFDFKYLPQFHKPIHIKIIESDKSIYRNFYIDFYPTNLEELTINDIITCPYFAEITHNINLITEKQIIPKYIYTNIPSINSVKLEPWLETTIKEKIKPIPNTLLSLFNYEKLDENNILIYPYDFYNFSTKSYCTSYKTSFKDILKTDTISILDLVDLVLYPPLNIDNSIPFLDKLNHIKYGLNKLATLSPKEITGKFLQILSLKFVILTNSIDSYNLTIDKLLQKNQPLAHCLKGEYNKESYGYLLREISSFLSYYRLSLKNEFSDRLLFKKEHI